MLKTLCFALAAFVAGVAAAQAPSRPDPAKPDWPAPKVEYQSVFSGYQLFQEQKSNVWKEVNKEVADNPGMGPMGAMKDMTDKGAAGMPGHGAMPMTKPQTSAAAAKTTEMSSSPVSGTGVIQQSGGKDARKPMVHDMSKGEKK